MLRLFLAILTVLAIIFVVPIVVYGAFQSAIGAEMPAGVTPVMFLLSVFVSKVGVAIAFCTIFYLAREALSPNWLVYAAIWFVFAFFGELGMMLGADYSWKEALAGLISEAIYYPASAYAVDRILKLD